MPSSSAAGSRIGARPLRRVVIPIVVLAILFVGSERVLGSASLPSWPLLRSRSGLPVWQLCQMNQIRTPGRPSDVLVMGSSRTGAAMDQKLMSRLQGGGPRSVERVAYTYGSPLDRDLAFRTYVGERGAPEVLGIELAFDPPKAGDPSPYAATARTHVMFDASVYRGMVKDLRRRQDVPLSDTYWWSRLQATPGYALRRVDAGTDLALRDPRAALSPTKQCNGQRMGYWDNAGLARPSTQLEPLTPRRARIWNRQITTRRPIDLDATWAQAKLKLTRDLVDYARRQGVEKVVFYHLPAYHEPADALDLDRIRREFPDVPIFDARPILENPDLPLLREQYGSASHVNAIGAYVLSQAFLDFVRRLP